MYTYHVTLVTDLLAMQLLASPDEKSIALFAYVCALLSGNMLSRFGFDQAKADHTNPIQVVTTITAVDKLFNQAVRRLIGKNHTNTVNYTIGTLQQADYFTGLFFSCVWFLW